MTLRIELYYAIAADFEIRTCVWLEPRGVHG
jgi:hypothetical protein